MRAAGGGAIENIATSSSVSTARAVAHSIAAVVLILNIITHIYAALWIQGTMRAMTRGTVTRAWGFQHHRLWAEQVVREEERQEAAAQSAQARRSPEAPAPRSR